jgi:hypothetical protein
MTRLPPFRIDAIPKAIPSLEHDGFNCGLFLGQSCGFVTHHAVVAADSYSFSKTIDPSKLLGNLFFFYGVSEAWVWGCPMAAYSLLARPRLFHFGSSEESRMFFATSRRIGDTLR